MNEYLNITTLLNFSHNGKATILTVEMNASYTMNSKDVTLSRNQGDQNNPDVTDKHYIKKKIHHIAKVHWSHDNN